MEVNISLDYSTISFKSQYITSVMIGADLDLIKNCGTVVNYPLTSLLPTIRVGDVITLDSTYLFNLDYIPDGVYNLTLKTYTSNPADRTDTEQYCLYSGTTTRCKAVELYNSTTDDIIKNKLSLILFALDNVNLCDTCSCAKMCDLYNDLLFILDTPITPTTNVHTDCGC